MFTEKQKIRAIELFCRDKTESRWPASCCLFVRGRFSRIGTQSAIRYTANLPPFLTAPSR